MPKVIVQKWEESERGWGTRPDGYSIHRNEAERKTYCEEYWKRMPASAPDEYSREGGTPYEADIEEAQYQTLINAVESGQSGVRYWDNRYPGDGGKDGWCNV